MLVLVAGHSKDSTLREAANQSLRLHAFVHPPVVFGVLPHRHCGRDKFGYSHERSVFHKSTICSRRNLSLNGLVSQSSMMGQDLVIEYLDLWFCGRLFLWPFQVLPMHLLR